MNLRKEAQEIRENRPEQISFNPPPLPYMGYINLLRRHDGGYLVAAIGHDDQAGQFNDGTMAAEIIDGDEVDQTRPRDHLAHALEKAHSQLMRLRVEAAVRLVAKIGRHYHDNETLISMLKDALANRQWE